MIKEVKYNGISAVPSDCDCPDGDLDLALDLIPEDGAIKPIARPVTVRTFPPGLRLRAVGIHDASASSNLLVVGLDAEEGKTQVCFCDNDDPSSSLQSLCLLDGEYRSYCAIGNTLVFATSLGLVYCLFKDGGYTVLGSRPPLVPISFGMVRKGALEDEFSSEYIDCPSMTGTYFTSDVEESISVSRQTDADKAAMESLSNSVMGNFLSKVSENVVRKGMFYQPFFIRYALRLYDGSYAWHSAPVLMLPDVCAPRVQIGTAVLDNSRLTVKSRLRVPYFALAKKILKADFSNLSDWSDVVSSIDVFISAPIYTYAQSKGVTGWTRLSNIYGHCYAAGEHRGSPSMPDHAFIGHWSESLSADGQDYNVKPADYHQYKAWKFAINENFEDSLTSCSLFYFHNRIPLEDIAEDQDYTELYADGKDLSSLVARQTLPDDWQSHFRLIPGFVTAYNSRLHLCDMSLGLPDPLPVRASVQATAVGQQITVRVWSRRNGVKCSVLSSFRSDADCFPISSQVPRWLWYPDPSAYMMMISCGAKNLIVPLEPHPTLNGAYWFAGLGADPQVTNADPDSTLLPDVAPALSKVYVSDATNPFTFPASGVVTVGSGHVFSLASAARALSQGQFGQFPLYAFTSDGVWALQVSETGSYSARQPITRDVCVNPASITQIDSAVLFATDRGIMLLSGSSSTCLTDLLTSPDSFSLLSLPKGDVVCGLAGLSEVQVEIVPFLDFLKGCGMVYDYVNQRIIVFNPAHRYAYVYSLKSKQWGMMRSSIAAAVNSYPDALAMDADSNLVSFSRPVPGEAGLSQVGSQLLVSRPLKLDNPNVLKTVDTVIQRGNFRKGHMRSVLYGSRDLVNWHLVWSSKDHFLRGFRGTPYKYYRIALLCDLDRDESIFGASVQFTPKLINQPR